MLNLNYFLLFVCLFQYFASVSLNFFFSVYRAFTVLCLCAFSLRHVFFCIFIFVMFLNVFFFGFSQFGSCMTKFTSRRFFDCTLNICILILIHSHNYCIFQHRLKLLISKVQLCLIAAIRYSNSDPYAQYPLINFKKAS